MGHYHITHPVAPNETANTALTKIDMRRKQRRYEIDKFMLAENHRKCCVRVRCMDEESILTRIPFVNCYKYLIRAG